VRRSTEIFLEKSVHGKSGKMEKADFNRLNCGERPEFPRESFQVRTSGESKEILWKKSVHGKSGKMEKADLIH
jgi:hypothetical protein